MLVSIVWHAAVGMVSIFVMDTTGRWITHTPTLGLDGLEPYYDD